MKNKILFLLNKCWNKKDSTLQNILFTLIINDYLGGKIGIHNNTYINVLDDELTDYTIVTRDEIINEDILLEYKLLKEKVDSLYNELEDINKHINNCHRCADLVETFDTKETISYGKSSNILVLGEAPANNGWRKSGRAFYDVNNKLLPSGKVLNQLLSEVNMNLEDVFFLEAIKCYPIVRNNLNVCKKRCKDYLDKQISLIEPKIILTMGDYPTKCLLDIKYAKYGDIVGKIFNYNNIIVIPIYHPSPISPLSYKGNIDIFKTTIKDVLNKEGD